MKLPHTPSLTDFLPAQIVDGGCLLADGTALGLVTGGAVTWDLLAAADRRQAYDAYHALLLALDRPLKISLIDQALDLQRAALALGARHLEVAGSSPLAAAILGEMIDTLADAAAPGATGQRQVVWQLAVAPPDPARPARLRRSARPAGTSGALARAVAEAERLATQLAALGGQPAPRPMRAPEIAAIWWLLLDPIRARRVPLHDALERWVTPLVGGACQEAGDGS